VAFDLMMRRRTVVPPGGRFRDRREAGLALANEVARRHVTRPVVLALPRGGVPVAVEVADRIGAPLDVLIVRKLGCPGRPELGIGAIAEGGVRLYNDEWVAALGITSTQLDEITARELREVERRAATYRGDRSRVPVEGRTAIVVDDGLATGYTARAAIAAVRTRRPDRVVLAVPVGSPATVAELGDLADEVVCPHTPRSFRGVGQFYTDFRQVDDSEVVTLLARDDPAATEAPPEHHEPGSPHARDVRIPAGSVTLRGTLAAPDDPLGVVVFAHGSGSSRRSPRNTAVARSLQAGGLATLLFDLLTDREAKDRSNAFDIRLLATRLELATRWLERQPECAALRIGYFGASTGATAALAAAARDPTIAAVVSRGGRPDLAGDALPQVTAPTLLIVGERDTTVVELNRRARRRLAGPTELAIVPGATHLFTEPGALERVATLALRWFAARLGQDRPTRSDTATTDSPPRRTR
jgi:putative phosphoribosyl transferase